MVNTHQSSPTDTKKEEKHKTKTSPIKIKETTKHKATKNIVTPPITTKPKATTSLKRAPKFVGGALSKDGKPIVPTKVSKPLQSKTNADTVNYWATPTGKIMATLVSKSNSHMPAYAAPFFELVRSDATFRMKLGISFLFDMVHPEDPNVPWTTTLTKTDKNKKQIATYSIYWPIIVRILKDPSKNTEANCKKWVGTLCKVLNQVSIAKFTYRSTFVIGIDNTPIKNNAYVGNFLTTYDTMMIINNAYGDSDMTQTDFLTSIDLLEEYYGPDCIEQVREKNLTPMTMKNQKITKVERYVNLAIET